MQFSLFLFTALLPPSATGFSAWTQSCWWVSSRSTRLSSSRFEISGNYLDTLKSASPEAPETGSTATTNPSSSETKSDGRTSKIENYLDSLSAGSHRRGSISTDYLSSLSRNPVRVIDVSPVDSGPASKVSKGIQSTDDPSVEASDLNIAQETEVVTTQEPLTEPVKSRREEKEEPTTSPARETETITKTTYVVDSIEIMGKENVVVSPNADEPTTSPTHETETITENTSVADSLETMSEENGEPSPNTDVTPSESAEEEEPTTLSSRDTETVTENASVADSVETMTMSEENVELSLADVAGLAESERLEMAARNLLEYRLKMEEGDSEAKRSQLALAESEPKGSDLTLAKPSPSGNILEDIWDSIALAMKEIVYSSAVTVQGGALRFWPLPSPKLEHVQILMKTEGRPLDANVEVWQGPDNTPQRMNVSIQDGSARTFNAIVATPTKESRTIAIRNWGLMEFPLSACVGTDVTGDLNSLVNRMSDGNKGQTVQGGSVRSYPFDCDVQKVHVLLKTYGRPLNATIEVLQGPNDQKQTIDLYSENGSERPFYAIFDTPDSAHTFRIVNTASIEFPLTAWAEPCLVKPGSDYASINDGTEDGWYIGASSKPSSESENVVAARKLRWATEEDAETKDSWFVGAYSKPRKKSIKADVKRKVEAKQESKQASNQLEPSTSTPEPSASDDRSSSDEEPIIYIPMGFSESNVIKQETQEKREL